VKRKKKPKEKNTKKHQKENNDIENENENENDNEDNDDNNNVKGDNNTIPKKKAWQKKTHQNPNLKILALQIPQAMLLLLAHLL